MKYYFCGSMTYDRSKKDTYVKLIEKIKEYGEVLNDFVGDTVVTDYEPSYVFKRDTNNLSNADFLVADLSVVSLGVGFEVGYYLQFGKPLVLMYDINKPLPSSLLRGVDKATVIPYENDSDAVKKLDEILKNAK